ncbi:MAG: ATP-binding protein [bacterium]|nr:ATP-binding protein [bacterium]
MLKENEYTELKKSTSELKEAIISLVAILNKHKKGELYFGIKNDGLVIGQEVSEKTLRDISKTISDNIEPKLYPEIKTEIIENKKCIKVSFSGENVPYFAFGRAYMRVADEDKQLSALELRKLILKFSEHTWESQISNKKIEEVNKETLKKCIQKANEVKRISFTFTNVKDVLRKLHLLKEEKLLHATELLFCEDNTAEIQAAVFAGKDKLTFLDLHQFRGNIFSLKEQAELYVKEHMNWRAHLTDKGREEIPEIPLRAIEEAIVNSLCHRDYSIRKGNEIAFYKDRIEIFNVGQFPEDKDPEDYLQGKSESVLRNPLIANTLFLSKDIEKWGSGIRRMYELCKQAGVKVTFEKTSTGFKVIFFRLEEFGGLNGGVFGGVFGGVNLLEYIKRNPGKRAIHIVHALNSSKRTIERQLKELKMENKIEFRGSAKTGGYYAK